MAKRQNLEEEQESVPITDAKTLKAEKKRLKKERKEQKKEARRKAKELTIQGDELEESGGSGGTVLLVTFLIVVIWLAILALLIKLDVGGFGSGVLKPMLQDVPVINKILPAGGMGGSPADSENGGETYYGYDSLQEAVEQIKRLELELESAQTQRNDQDTTVQELQEEIERLKTFENNQVEFEQIKNQFYEEVVYADKGPGAEAYQKYYESMDPATAETLYKQVVQQLEEDGQVEEYATAYSEMKPKEAAAIFESMEDDLDLAAKILNAMDATDRGKILGAMDSEVAARITKIMEPSS